MDTQTYPLGASGASAIADVSNDELARLFMTAPVIYRFGVSTRVVRISEQLVLKGGLLMTRCEAETQKFAAEQGFPVPTVHRVFRAPLHNPNGVKKEGWLMVMDFVPGQKLTDVWPRLDQPSREKVVHHVADWVNCMQSKLFNRMPPGPVGGSDDEPWTGPWFTDYGAGPFATREDMEYWYNHKLDVGLRHQQAPQDLPRFEFHDLVLTHQDIAP